MLQRLNKLSRKAPDASHQGPFAPHHAFPLGRYETFGSIDARPGGEVVTLRSAKPTCTGSIPVLASKYNACDEQVFYFGQGIEKVVEILRCEKFHTT